MNTQNVKVDSKGRVIIPNSFREMLGIKDGENIVAELDKENERIILFPIEKKAMRMHVLFGDEPGALSRVAAVLAKNKVDLIYSASRSLKRGKEAEWEITADFSKADMKRLRAELDKEKAAKKFRIENLH